MLIQEIRSSGNKKGEFGKLSYLPDCVNNSGLFFCLKSSACALSQNLLCLRSFEIRNNEALFLRYGTSLQILTSIYLGKAFSGNPPISSWRQWGMVPTFKASVSPAGAPLEEDSAARKGKGHG